VEDQATAVIEETAAQEALVGPCDVPPGWEVYAGARAAYLEGRRTAGTADQAER
jgi:hypothetical protein